MPTSGIMTKDAFYKRRGFNRQDLDIVQKTNSCITVCANCHKVRDLDGKWYPIESSLLNAPNYRWSHSICPDCVEQQYGKESWYQKWLAEKRGKSMR